MTFQIIIKGAKYGKTKSEIAENLRKDGIEPDGLFNTREEEEMGRYLDKKLKLRKLDKNEIKKIKKRKI